MVQRLTLLIVAGLTLSVILSSEAVAQPHVEDSYFLRQPQRISLTTLIFYSQVPVSIQRAEAPESLSVDEDGIFAVTVNGDAATLPIRPEWNFGDGTTARGLSARHRYDEPGTYDVTFTVSNPSGTDSTTMTVRVTPDEAEDESPHL